MKTRGRLPLIPLLLIACAALLLSACRAPGVPALPVQDPAATPLRTQFPASRTGEFSVDVSGAAQDWASELIAAVPPGGNRPAVEALPQHHRATLLGYPVTSNRQQPRIFVFPAAELAQFNPAAAQAAADLQAMLQAGAPGERLPYLPPRSDVQALHARVRFLDFQNGSGVAYLTQFNQGPVKVNNAGLLYTFQGLTADGKFYVAVVLPVIHPELPENELVFSENPDALGRFPEYMAETAAWLEQQPAARYTPDLENLDALVRSILVQ